MSQIFALLGDLPVGNLRGQIGLALRHTWLINIILCNSEVWHIITDEPGDPRAHTEHLRGLQ